MREGLLWVVLGVVMLVLGLVIGKGANECDCAAEVARNRNEVLEASAKRCGEVMATLAEVKEHDEKHGYPHQ